MPYIKFIFFYHGATAPSGPRPLIIEDSLNSDTLHLVGLLWTSDQPDALTTHNTHNRQTDIHAPGRIRTRNPRKGKAADPRLSQRVHWDRFTFSLHNVILRCVILVVFL